MFSWLLEGREREQDVAYEARARELNEQLMTTMAAGKPTLETIATLIDKIATTIACDGVALWNNDDCTISGVTPTRTKSKDW